MARSGVSSNLSGGKKGGPARFLLALGSEECVFDCTDDWQNFEINAVRITGPDGGNNRISPQLEMMGKGTAWFDLLQVYPDMAIKVGRGDQGKSSIVELITVHPDAKIYYTTDGSEPTVESLNYTGPFEVKSSSIVNAVAYKDGRKVGYIEEKVSP